MNLSHLDPVLLSVLGALVGYLIGSLSFAVIVSRLFKLADPRTYGSGNPGATNVLRSGNKGAAILTLLFDALKGYVPVVLAIQMGLGEMVVMLVGLGAFIGHLWPVFFKFEGGKGVATAAGVLLGFSAALGGVVLLVWVVMAVVFRYSSLASLSAAVAAPIVQGVGWGFGPLTVGVFVMSALLVWRHDANIRKLLAGQESKLGQKAKVAVPTDPQ
ncbi:MAG: glycerol-3-phosphate 1-O-acyltransferase PlsY [Aquabacterium sp.]|jgi:glycerol-3-phosphate acyltransferase PlsY|uniref:glycerol-3-phosphate 1-O-acyltransferase PlsY n=1 Tax=Aquabacterium sp. TaxID=1872578 RepID=UPI001B4F1793|nr:glycerol-3-phosphate 1-O-acyltransferase PlsY [Aquabacterium sp.]MBP7132373.1 glycerol-3-phosphate 1-O-acyltransferase PlsY [Aquabacterium sp.]MBP9063335.1 glycerol-3-phosphate 1-O-acyltransferase PlsY [Aquabacterium sp.]MDQ5926396.1 Glycerol-3-phosphate acyltransferase [Pseudomonadota bacterium]